MNKKILYIVIVVLLAVVVVGGVYLFSNRGARTGTPGQQATSSPTPVSTLSEQPNLAKFDEYLSDIYLGKLPIGKKIGVGNFPTRTDVFTKGSDQLCTMMTLKKNVASGALAVAIYDTVAKQYSTPKTVFPMELRAGGNGGCNDLTQSPGKYEYKLYLDNVLASVLPFEVR